MSFFLNIQSAVQNIGNPLQRTLTSFKNVVPVQLDDSQQELLNRSILELFVYVIKTNDEVKSSEIEAVTVIIRDLYGHHLINDLMSILDKETLPKLESICANLKVLGDSERETLLQGLFIICFADNEFCIDEQQSMIKIARLLDISLDRASNIEQQALQKHNSRMRALNSSTGLVAAIVVMAIFILAATFLRSVFYGLILAYLFLTLQERFQHSFLNNGFTAKSFHLIRSIFVAPFVRISNFVKNRFGSGVVQRTVSEADKVKIALSRSCHGTVAFVSLSMVTLFVAIIGFTAIKYQSMSIESIQENLVHTSDQMRSIPIINLILDRLHFDTTTNLEQVEQSLMEYSEEVFHYGFVFLNSVGHIFLNGFLSIFFFSFFLKQMAEFQLKKGDKSSVGDYLVISLFQSSWFPNTTKETITSTTDIIDHIIFMLKTWVRGYIWIILVEVPIYCILFTILGIPYAIPLGVIAGLTVLLPFVGPLVSFVLTCGVALMFFESLTFGNMTFMYILVIYFVLHSIIEQLFLYPALVGEALGLNVIETVIVVLLGGIFAGVTGMILAVPVASILKFMIPKVYQTQMDFQPLNIEKNIDTTSK